MEARRGVVEGATFFFATRVGVARRRAAPGLRAVAKAIALPPHTGTHLRNPSPRLGVELPIFRDIETASPHSWPYSMISFALVFAGTFDGKRFQRPVDYSKIFYAELQPISDQFQSEALAVNGLNRARLCTEGEDPADAMSRASNWIIEIAGSSKTFRWSAHELQLGLKLVWCAAKFSRCSRSAFPIDINTVLQRRDHGVAFRYKCLGR